MPLSLPPHLNHIRTLQQIDSYNKDGRSFHSRGTHYLPPRIRAWIPRKVIYSSTEVNNSCWLLRPHLNPTSEGSECTKNISEPKSACVRLLPLTCCFSSYYLRLSFLAVLNVQDLIEILSQYRLHMSRLASAAILQRLIKINSDLKLLLSVTFIA